MKRWFALVLVIGSLVVVGGCKTVGGAAVGAGIGALAGDAATGAAIGAGVGLVGDIIDSTVRSHKLDRLANHVIVIGFGALGRLVQADCTQPGEVVITDDLIAGALVDRLSKGDKA